MKLNTSFLRNSSHVRAQFGESLPLDYVAQRVPSITASHAHESRSERYSMVDTLSVLRTLDDEGYRVVEAVQGRCRDKNKQEYTKHLVWLQHADTVSRTDQDNIFRIGLMNSHDGTSSYRLMAGIMRQVCLNGMIVGQAYSDVRVPHRGDVTGRVIEGVYSVVEESPQVADEIERMKSLTLNRPMQEAFAEAAAMIRWNPLKQEADEGQEEDTKPEPMLPIRPTQLLTPRRFEDRGDDLWRVLNRTQENVIRGGLTGLRNPDTGRRMSARRVTSIDKDININRNLWDLASAIVKLSSAA